MEAIKSTIGLGKKESGEEPVSGETGTGTVAEPYDAGNSDEAQEVAKAQPEQQDTQETKPVEDKETSSGGGLTSTTTGWLSSIIPLGSKPKDTSDEQASAGAPTESAPTQPSTSTSAPAPAPAPAESSPAPAPVEEDETARPPNHLGVNVPSGHGLGFAPSQPEEPTPATPSEPKDKQRMANTTPNPNVQAAPAQGADTASSPPRSGSTGKSPAQLRGSRASIAPPPGTRIFNPSGQNPGRIPTAGGRPLGEAAAERRRSMWSGSSMDEGSRSEMPKLDKQGSPDPVTAQNTVVNTVPQSPNGEGSSKGAATNGAPAFAPVEPIPEKKGKEPKPDFNTFAWGEGGEGAATSAGANGSKAGTSTPSSSATPSKTEQVKEKVMPSSGGNSADVKKERRASGFGRFKQKMGIGKSKS